MPTTKQPQQPKNERLIVRIDSDTRDALAILARQFGCNLSVAVRYAILNAPIPVAPPADTTTTETVN